jgi:hypothetical protein
MSDHKCPLLMDVHMPKAVADALRALGYGITTIQDLEGTSRPANPMTDHRIVEIATERRWAVVTQNAGHFRAIGKEKRNHKGIIICKVTDEHARLANAIDQKIKETGVLHGQVIEVTLD